jgi:hypothetical protein
MSGIFFDSIPTMTFDGGLGGGQMGATVRRECRRGDNKVK